MSYFSDFLRQKTPAPEKVMPAYYRKALIVSEFVLACYFLAVFFLLPMIGHYWEWVPAVICVATAVCLLRISHMNIVQNFLCFSGIVVLWSGWGVYVFGWGIGIQHFLMLLLLFLFFNICISPPLKILSGLLVLGYRIGLYAFARSSAPLRELTPDGGILFQTANSTIFYLLVALICILLSSSIQDTERQLRLDNENLNKEAGTDPLTGLPNRREMISIIERYQKDNPEKNYSVAIADIDYFKKVNDTYGHACGDATLIALTDLFKSESKDRYKACRWGGEEFCFFLPEMNLDEAGQVMNDLNFAVERLPLEYEDKHFNITITVGVEETDFQSTLEQLLDSADEKLYLGKNSGRNRVVV